MRRSGKTIITISETGLVFEISIIAGNQSHSPLTSACRDPGVRRPHRMPGRKALGRNVSPRQACFLVRKQWRVKRDEILKKRPAFGAPVVANGPKRELGQRHETDHQMIALGDAIGLAIQAVTWLEQNRDRVGIEEEVRHRGFGFF